MNETQRRILEHWYAWIYEQEEDEAEMSAYLRKELGKGPLCVLEAACGGAKLCETLAQVGHDVTGIDRDAAMLAFARARAERLPSLYIRQADMPLSPWEGILTR